MSDSQHNAARFRGQEYQLGNRIRRLRRLKWAARPVDNTTAAFAFSAFTSDLDDDDDLDIAFGKLLVILDRHFDLEGER
jgi:hypothetical protein